MTVQRPQWLQNVGNVYTAEEMRRGNKFRANRQAGVSQAGDYAVSQNGTPNMSVNVAAGEAHVNGSETTTQGSYYAYNDAVLNRTIAASDATNPRNDLVVVRVRDQFYSGTFNDGDAFVVPGTPAPSPVDPAAPANSLILARVAVAANATTITNANITDLRPQGVLFSNAAANIQPLAAAAAAGSNARGALADHVHALNGLMTLFAAGSAIFGTTPSLATTKMLIQGGNVVVTTNASGDASFNFPTPFPTGLLTVILTPGDIGVGGSFAVNFVTGTNATSVAFRVYTGYPSVLATASSRVNWIAIGW